MLSASDAIHDQIWLVGAERTRGKSHGDAEANTQVPGEVTASHTGVVKGRCDSADPKMNKYWTEHET